MKTIISKYLPYLIVVIILSSCNPFISKELRHKNKCNKRLEKLVEKCPELMKHDTLLFPFEVKIPQIIIKDSITVRVDTVELLRYVTKDQIRYIVRTISIDTSYSDSLYRLEIRLYNGVLSWDVEIAERIIKDSLQVPTQVVQPIKLKWHEVLANQINSTWRWLIALIIILLFALFIYSRIKKL